jgi:hypothetical protein
MKTFLGLASFILFFVSCKHSPDNYKSVFNDPLLYCKTVKKLNDVVMENNFPPIVACRNYTYANIAAYECMVAGDSSYISLAGQLKGLTRLPQPDKTVDIDFHLAALLAFTKVGNAVTFPEGSMMGYYDQLKKMADSSGMSSLMLRNSVTFSDAIAAAILKWSSGDQYAQTRSAEKYTVTDEEGRWIPTPPAYAQALEPHWDEIRLMVLDSCNEIMPPPPPLLI